MKRKSLFALVSLIALVAAQPLWGGTVYSYALNQTVGGNEFTTQIRISNDSGDLRTVHYLFIPAESDGTVIDRELESTEVTVRPRATVRVDDAVPAGAQGLLEFRADEDIAVTARLIGTTPDGGQTFGVELPVVDSVRAIAPGKTAILQGLARTEDQVESDFFIVNLSLERATCAVEVRRRGGAQVVDEVISVPPLSLSPFLDVLGLLNVENAGDVAFAVTCDQLARPFAITHQITTAELLYIPPSGTGQSTLDPFPSNECPPDALFQLPGDFHVPAVRNERATFFVPTAPGETYSRLVLTMEITNGGWNRFSSGNHAGFWLNRTDQWAGNLFGYLNFFGPNKNFVRLATNVDLPRGVLETEQAGLAMQEGETYAISYTYDAAANFVEAVITRKGGEEVARLNGRTTVRNVRTADNFMLVFGHGTHEAGPEVTTYNWRYSNLCLRLE